MTQDGRFKMVPPKLKMVDLSARVRRRNLFDSAQEQSTAFVNQHSECLQEGKKPSEKQKKGQNSAFLNTEHKEQFLRFPVCFIQSVTPSLRARSEHSVRDVGAAHEIFTSAAKWGWVSRELWRESRRSPCSPHWQTGSY